MLAKFIQSIPEATICLNMSFTATVVYCHKFLRSMKNDEAKERKKGYRKKERKKRLARKSGVRVTDLYTPTRTTYYHDVYRILNNIVINITKRE